MVCIYVCRYLSLCVYIHLYLSVRAHLYQASLILMYSIYCLVSFTSARRLPLVFLSGTGVLAMKSFTFYLSGSVLISLSFLKNHYLLLIDCI